MNLVTVCGHNTTMLYHMLNHYHLHMDEIFVVLYAHHKKDPIIEQGLHILEKFNLKPHKIVYERPFDWERVTQHYNETKLLKLNSKKSNHYLGWKQKLNFNKTVEFTSNWYLNSIKKSDIELLNFSIGQIQEYLDL